MKIRLEHLIEDRRLSPRLGLDPDTVDRYTEIFDQLPPVLVYLVDGEHLLVDGFHRTEAAYKLGLTELEAEVIEGTREQAIEYAITSNTKHGHPLTTEDRHRAVLILKAIHKDWGYKKLAKAVGCAHTTVEDVLKAEEVRQKVVSTTLAVRATTKKGKPKKKPVLTDKHLAEIHEAPKEDAGSRWWMVQQQ